MTLIIPSSAKFCHFQGVSHSAQSYLQQPMPATFFGPFSFSPPICAFPLPSFGLSLPFSFHSGHLKPSFLLCFSFLLLTQQFF
ncbi:Vacuolar protein sorting-associated protein 2-like 1 isoform C [Glycine soja]|uniref:Vacuolar protein sorting-associated protein 2-like 1 isoform C n=1 Tax=Glycine soja TaxID=3848 RepID=A0A445GUS7_GLYSO|nr:Vacuolar protein sorting-associated protein 2-like 1 isoform C [Glycine soja]